MQDPITRILTTLEILQSRDRVTGTELAHRLEVDLRTVQRYIAKLRELNIPIVASAGVGGAYCLRPGFRLPPLLLTNEEAFALSLGLHALRQIGLEAFAPATEAALSKLQRVLPETVRESMRTVEDVVALEPSSWRVSTPAQNLIGAAQAIRNSRRVRFAYQSHRGETSERQIEPYAVLHTDDRWYLIGHCLHRRATRTFRLDRLTRFELSTTTFDRPENFDARTYLAERLPFVQSLYQIDLWIDLPMEEARCSFALWRVELREQDGGTRLRCGRDNLDFFASMLLSTRRRMTVHAPSELRETFQALSLQAAAAAITPSV